MASDRRDEPSGSPAPGPGLELVEPLGSRTWLARTCGGRTVAARWICGSTAGDPAALAGGAAALAALPGTSLVPVLGVARCADAVWLVSEFDAGVSLRRLLQVARLSPQQAAAVVAGVGAGLDALHAAGYVHGRVHPGNVHVGPDGDVRLGDWGPAGLGPHDPQDEGGADLAGVAALAARLAAAARTPLAELESALDGPEQRARARAELATLVVAVAGNGRPRDDRPPASRGPGRTGARRAVRTAWLRLGALVATVTVLGGVVGLEYTVLRDQIGENLARLLQSPAPGEGADRTPAPATRRPGAVPVLAPAAAGPVMGVDVRALRSCAPGRICPVRVLVRVWPQAEPLQVRWAFHVVDRCTGARTGRPGRVAEVLPGSDRVDGLSHVRLPRGRSLAVVAVTSAPARVAAPPLPVPAGGASC